MSWAPWRTVRDLVLRNQDAQWSAAERLVALTVADCMDESGSARPSIGLVMSRSALSRRTVQRALARLAGPEGIYAEETGGSTHEGGRRASVYTLSTSAMVTPVPASQRRGSDQRHSDTGVIDDADQRHSDAPRSKEGLNVVGATHRVPDGTSSKPMSSSLEVASSGESVSEKAPRRAARFVRRPSSGNGKPGGWPARFAAAYTERLGGTVAPGRVGRELAAVITAHGEEATFVGWVAYLAEAAGLDRKERRFVSPADFARRAGDFIPNGRPAPPPPPPEERGPVFSGPRRYAS